jgi:hypothetical protein
MIMATPVISQMATGRLRFAYKASFIGRKGRGGLKDNISFYINLYDFFSLPKFIFAPDK